MTRSLTMDVFVLAEHLQAVLDSIRRYRASCRQLFGVLACAQAAGAEIVDADKLSLKPNTAQAQAILRQVFGLEESAKAKALAYPARRWFLDKLYPGAMSFVWDSARRQVVSRWQAMDPEWTKAQRGWLILQGARGVAEFKGVGIEFPQATAHPKLEERSITLKWDQLGSLTFSVGQLDPGRWHTWTMIRDGEWPAGTVILNERDGRLRMTIAHERPEAFADVDKELKLTVSVDAGTPSLVLTGPTTQTDEFGLADAIGMLDRLKRQSELWLRRKEATGNPNRAWGNKKAWRATVEHLNRVTLNRERFVSDCNHAWTRRIVSRAKPWRCGTIVVTVPPDLGGHPWKWKQFEDYLRYKAEESGCSLTIEKIPENAESSSMGAPALPEAVARDAR